jgi:hypothetical protein
MLYEKKLMEFHVFSTVFSTIRRRKKMWDHEFVAIIFNKAEKKGMIVSSRWVWRNALKYSGPNL